jgi:hypothetical protein
MDTTKLLAKPKAQPQVVAKVTKINSLAKLTSQTNKSSRILRRTFEKGIYQRKTQLSILNRYKKRLDSIQKEQDNKSTKKLKRKPPKFEIPKFKGSFFTNSGDLLSSLGALAAFKSLGKMFDGDMGGALGPGMIAAAALLGPGLLGMAGNAMFNKGPKPRRGFDVTGRRVSSPTQERYLSRYGDKAFKNRFGKDALKRTQQGTEVVSNVGKGGKVAKAFGRFGAALIPGVGAVVGAADAAYRAQSGDQFGAALSGTAATLDAAAAASAATGIGLPVAGLLSIASFALDATNLVRDLSGMSAAEEEKNKKKEDKLDKNEREQKALASQSGNLTFAKTLVGYGKVVEKFQKFSRSFTGTLDPSNPYNETPTGPPPSAPPGGAYDGPISGETFFPLPGGDVGTQGRIGENQKFGASRDGGSRPHAGLDMTHWSGPLNAPVSAFKTGKVVKAVHAGYRGSVDIDHGGGLYTRYVHVVPSVSVGQIVYGGQQIATLYPDGGNTHLHFEVYQGNSAKDPAPILSGVKNRITSPLSVERAREHSSSGANAGMVVDAAKTGQLLMVHGKEAIIPIDNYHTASGGDPLQNVSPDIVNQIISKSKIYRTTLENLPPEVIEVPMPVIPPQIKYISTGSGSLNTQSNDADQSILKMLYYSALG